MVAERLDDAQPALRRKVDRELATALRGARMHREDDRHVGSDPQQCSNDGAQLLGAVDVGRPVQRDVGEALLLQAEAPQDRASPGF